MKKLKPRRKSIRSKEKTPVFKGLPANRLKLFKKELSGLKERLAGELEQKQDKELAQAVEMDPGDDADVAAQTYEKEMLFEISGSERETLMAIEEALRKVANKTYGQCDFCKKPIPLKRLKVLPYTRYCLKCQSTYESKVV